MARVIVFIDGFNVYHALCEHGQAWRCKWIDYWKLAETYVVGDDQLVGACWFTAYQTWGDPEKVKRHKRLEKVQRDRGVEVVRGRYGPTTEYCPTCKKEYPGHEEKATDINIALKMFEYSHADRMDKAILISADSDYEPVFHTLRRLFPRKKYGIIVPIGRTGDRVRHAANFQRRMTLDDLQAAKLPNSVQLRDGTILTIPDEW